MATIRKLKTGKWQAQVARQGVRKSKTFPTKYEARDWAARQEHIITTKPKKVFHEKTFGELLDRYGREVSITKRGARWEIIRIKALQRDEISQKRLKDLTKDELGKWRDRRMAQVSPDTVRREMKLMSSALNVAKKEWEWLPENPLGDVRRPPSSPSRDRLISATEIEQIVGICGDNLSTIAGRVGKAFLFAIETAMRAGEIAAMRNQDVDLVRRVATLPMTKNGTQREVPLTSKAVEILQGMPAVKDGSLRDLCFGLRSSQIDTSFRRVKAAAGISDLHFHDTRHEAITRLAKKLDVLTLARMVGHKNINQLQTYYNERAEDIAKRLD